MTPSDRSVPQTSTNQSIEPVLEGVGERIAEAHGIQPFYHYSEKEAAKLLRLSVSTLKRARNSDSIGYIQKGSRSVAYFGYQLVHFLIAKTTCPTLHPESIK